MVFDWFKRLFKNKQALVSIQTNKQTNTQTNKQALAIESTTESSLEPPAEPPIELEKESLQLGIAGGLTGRFIRDIDKTLNRIETLMPSKDWLTIQLHEQFSQHEQNEQKRFETIVNALNTLHSISIEAPEPVKTRLIDEIHTVESRLGLSKRMKELIQLLKYSGEASYADLAKKMDLTESGFRSLLAMTLTRTNEIEKFERDNRKWLRCKQTYKQTGDSNVQTDVSSVETETNKQTSEKID